MTTVLYCSREHLAQWSSKQALPEGERQCLIAELRRLRREGLSVDRQEAIVSKLRSGWELGWP